MSRTETLEISTQVKCHIYKKVTSAFQRMARAIFVLNPNLNILSYASSLPNPIP